MLRHSSENRQTHRVLQSAITPGVYVPVTSAPVTAPTTAVQAITARPTTIPPFIQLWYERKREAKAPSAPDEHTKSCANDQKRSPADRNTAMLWFLFILIDVHQMYFFRSRCLSAS